MLNDLLCVYNGVCCVECQQYTVEENRKNWVREGGFSSGLFSKHIQFLCRLPKYQIRFTSYTTKTLTQYLTLFLFISITIYLFATPAGNTFSRHLPSRIYFTLYPLLFPPFVACLSFNLYHHHHRRILLFLHYHTLHSLINIILFPVR